MEASESASEDTEDFLGRPHEVIRNVNLTEAAMSTALCSTREDVTHLYHFHDKKRALRNGLKHLPLKMLAMSGGAGLLATHYRIAPTMKWCLRGKEHFTSSQKRVSTRGFTEATGASSMWWFSEPSVGREELGVRDDVNTPHRTPVDPMKLNQFIGSHAGRFSVAGCRSSF